MAVVIEEITAKVLTQPEGGSAAPPTEARPASAGAVWKIEEALALHAERWARVKAD